MPKLQHIHRYPLKGFSYENLETAQLRTGFGLEDDRRFALSIVPDVDGTRWVKSRSFIINSVIDNLQKYSFTKSDGLWTLTNPDGQKLSFDPNNQNSQNEFNTLLAEFVSPLIGSDVSPHLVERKIDNQAFGMWDYADTPLSIINIETVKSLSDITGSYLDPVRFRGNLVIDGLHAWDEFCNGRQAL